MSGRMPKRCTSSALSEGVGANVHMLVTTASISVARRPCHRKRTLASAEPYGAKYSFSQPKSRPFKTTGFERSISCARMTAHCSNV